MEKIRIRLTSLQKTNHTSPVHVMASRSLLRRLISRLTTANEAPLSQTGEINRRLLQTVLK